jgi:hypothetical protein
MVHTFAQCAQAMTPCLVLCCQLCVHARGLVRTLYHALHQTQRTMLESVESNVHWWADVRHVGSTAPCTHCSEVLRRTLVVGLRDDGEGEGGVSRG